MLLNMYAVPVTKVLLPRLKTLKKLSTILKMNYKTHVQSQSLSDQAMEFRAAYGTTNSMANRTMQLDLIAEEYQEFRQSMREGFEQELKELSDLVYVCFQYAENMGWDLEEALRRVHKSNMSKLGVDGTPIRRRDGKIMKGPNYQPPNLTDLVT
jgi:predicted HAD superfamily Cof-like phosphohydrolase